MVRFKENSEKICIAVTEGTHKKKKHNLTTENMQTAQHYQSIYDNSKAHQK